MEKQALEKECQQFQEESLREESRYFYLQNLISMSKIRLERCEQEKRWQSGKESMLRDIKCLKDLYAVSDTSLIKLDVHLKLTFIFFFFCFTAKIKSTRVINKAIT